MNLANQLLDLDVRLLYWSEVQRQKRPILSAAKGFSRSGDGYLQVLVVGLLAVAPSPETRTLAIWLSGVFAFERLIYYVMKNVLKRQRPPVALRTFTAVIAASDQFSFPSGHTSAAFLLVAVFYLLNWTIFWIALPWAMAVGASRVILGVHFPSDIIAGAILGTSVAYLTSLLYPVI